MGNSRSLGLLNVFKVLEFQLDFPTSGIWGGTCFLIAPFPDRCLFLPFHPFGKGLLTRFAMFA